MMATAQDKAPAQSMALANISFDRQFQLALEPTNMTEAYKASSLAASIGIGGVKSAEEALIRIMTGRSLGLQMMSALRYVYIVDGKPALDAQLMHGLCLAREDCTRFECIEDTDEAVAYVIQRGERKEFTVRYTIKDAERAGLLSKKNWRENPRKMLQARCKAEGAQRGWPDVMSGCAAREDLESAIDTVGIPMDEPFVGEVAAPAIPRAAPQRDATETVFAQPTNTIPAPGGAPPPPQPEKRGPGRPRKNPVAAPPPPPPEAELVDDEDEEPPTAPPAKEPPKEPEPVKAPPAVEQPAQHPPAPAPAPSFPTHPPAPVQAPAQPSIAPPPAAAPFSSPPQASARDFDGELRQIQSRLSAARTFADLNPIKEDIKRWDAPSAWVSSAKDAYNSTHKAIRDAAPSAVSA